MKLSDFDFDLPDALIATRPANPRTSARLLHVENGMQDAHVSDLPGILRPNDLLVLNNTKVILARLTGRRDRIRTLRKGGGLSGFTKRAESEYDPFGAAHSSTSISAGMGFAVARDLDGRDTNVVSVIGDGSITAGMAYEAMNNAGASDSRQIVILNDNDMSIAPPVGAMSHYFSRLVSSRSYRGLRRFAKSVAKPIGLENPARKAEEYLRGFAMGGTMFEELGFYYVGPIDGHDLDVLRSEERRVGERV